MFTLKLIKMTDDILAQIVLDLISDMAKFSLQFDKTTNASNLSQLAVFVHYGNKEDVKKEVFLFYQPLITTKAAKVKKFVDNFFRAIIFHRILFMQFVWTELESCWNKILVLVHY